MYYTKIHFTEFKIRKYQLIIDDSCYIIVNFFVSMLYLNHVIKISYVMISNTIITFLRDYKKSNFISDFLLNDHDMNFILLLKF